MSYQGLRPRGEGRGRLGGRIENEMAGAGGGRGAEKPKKTVADLGENSEAGEN